MAGVVTVATGTVLHKFGLVTLVTACLVAIGAVSIICVVLSRMSDPGESVPPEATDLTTVTVPAKLRRMSSVGVATVEHTLARAESRGMSTANSRHRTQSNATFLTVALRREAESSDAAGAGAGAGAAAAAAAGGSRDRRVSGVVASSPLVANFDHHHAARRLLRYTAEVLARKHGAIVSVANPAGKVLLTSYDADLTSIDFEAVLADPRGSLMAPLSAWALHSNNSVVAKLSGFALCVWWEPSDDGPVSDLQLQQAASAANFMDTFMDGLWEMDYWGTEHGGAGRPLCLSDVSVGDPELGSAGVDVSAVTNRIADLYVEMLKKTQEHPRQKIVVEDRWSAGRPRFLAACKYWVDRNLPVKYVLPCFPFKSGNTTSKTLGKLPDMAEFVALRRLDAFCRRIEEFYPPGAEITLFTDGRVYAEAFEIPDDTATECECAVFACRGVARWFLCASLACCTYMYTC